MTRLPRITAKQMIAALKRAGWIETRTRGSHIHMKHSKRPGRVTIPRHSGQILMPKLVLYILDQAGLTVEELASLL